MELEHLVDGEWKTIKELKWVLDVWEPSTFCTTMLTYFSPLQVFMIYLSSSRNKELILLSYCSMAFIWLLVDYYGKKLTDSEIMSGELMNTKVDKQLQYSVVCTPRK